MKEQEQEQPEEDRYHYGNGSIDPCDDESCEREHHTLDAAVDELTADATQGLYKPRHAAEVQA